MEGEQHVAYLFWLNLCFAKILKHILFLRKPPVQDHIDPASKSKCLRPYSSGKVSWPWPPRIPLPPQIWGYMHWKRNPGGGIAADPKTAQQLDAKSGRPKGRPEGKHSLRQIPPATPTEGGGR